MYTVFDKLFKPPSFKDSLIFVTQLQALTIRYLHIITIPMIHYSFPGFPPLSTYPLKPRIPSHDES